MGIAIEEEVERKVLDYIEHSPGEGFHNSRTNKAVSLLHVGGLVRLALERGDLERAKTETESIIRKHLSETSSNGYLILCASIQYDDDSFTRGDAVYFIPVHYEEIK